MKNEENLLIYLPKLTTRARYIFKFIFQDILRCTFEFTCNEQEFIGYSGPKFSYSNHKISDELFFACRPLLFETGLKDQDLHPFDFNGIKVFYSTNKSSALPFDPFAASFFLVSRYEEYLPAIRDQHDRFEATESIAYQHQFLQKPVVDIWAYEIKKILQKKFPNLSFEERTYNYLSTIDIDNAYAIKEKGIVRAGAGLMRSLLAANFKEFWKRILVLLRLETDPFDTYDLQLDIQKKYNLNTIYFFLFADYGFNDKNVPVNNTAFHHLIKSIADNSTIGIHPSYGSNKNKNKLELEIKRLSKVINREINFSRQHFLKLRLPETYKNLLELDITDDFTMGYAGRIGFRAGTCTNFNFYDLDSEIETKLKVHPFQVMDATLCNYMKIQPEDSLKIVKPIIDEIKAVNGTFVTLWHNESISNVWPWKGWRNVYEEIVIEALAENQTQLKNNY